VAEQEKKYKPLFEALMAKTDGLDILAEITGEKAPEEKKPEERKEAAAPTDTLGGMLQTLPMLIMLPAIMPLIQQMLTQTLAASTVNVKVESATTILPIEISASTAIVPIEIKASTVTLNVNITGSNVTLNVNITGSVPLNVNIVEPQTLTVYIDNVREGVVFNTKITECPITLNVQITECPITLNVQITECPITLNIHIESIEPGVTFNIHIDSVNPSVTFNMKITECPITLTVYIDNVNPTVTFNIKITGIEPGVTFNIKITGVEPAVVLNIHIDSVNPNVTFNVSVVGTVKVTGTVSISGTVNVTGTVSISGTVSVTGTVSIDGTVNVTGTVSIDGTVNVTGTVSISGTVNVSVEGIANVNITNRVVQTANPKPCLAFDGVDDYVAVPDSSSWKPSSLTAEIWIYPYAWLDQATSYNSHHFYPAGDGFGITTSPSNWIYWIKTSAGRQTRSVSHGNQLNMWHQVVLTYDQATGNMKFYVDGVLKDTYNLGAGTAIAWGSGVLKISHAPNYATYGRIMCARIYNRALSDSEIQRNYNDPESPVTNGLVLWLKMNEGTGTIVYDYSGNNNNGTIYGAKWVSSVGSAPATINVNITGSNVTLNVNITGSDVTLNVTGTVSISGTVNVTGTVNINTVSGIVNVNVQQAVDLKIYTPSGKWVVASDLLPKLTERQIAALPAATETTIRDLTGRGRLRTLSFLVYDTGAAFDIANDIRIRVYVDGSLRFEISLIGVDSFSGYPADYLRQALMYAIAIGAALPFNTAKFATSPDRYIIMPPQTSPLGGLTMAVWDQTNSKFRVMAGYINLAMEFTSSLSIRIYNRNSSYSAYAIVSYEIGEYP